MPDIRPKDHRPAAVNPPDDLSAIVRLPRLRRYAAYSRLSGPGYMQGAMTLGGGSIASCVVLGSLLGYELLWVQPLAILLGFFVLAAIARQTCATGERPYHVFWTRLHPSLAIVWAASALIATVIWHIPQYSLTANGVVSLAEGAGLNLGTAWGRAGIGAVALAAACVVVRAYHAGGRGLRRYELSVKILVWSIVVAFGAVAFSTGIEWRRFFTGVTGITTLQRLAAGGGFEPAAIKPVVGGLAAAVGINMIFLYPYTLLNKNYGPDHRELATFDLVTGLALPFLIATTLMILAVANTIGPAEGAPAGQAVRDIREIVPVLGPAISRVTGGGPALGGGLALFFIGFGMIAVGFSTIVMHMLAAGFIGCELFGFDARGRALWWFSLLPAVGVVGVAIPFPWYAAITASTLALPLMPVAIVCFMILLNRSDYMGEAAPRGPAKFAWNAILTLAVVVFSIAAFYGMESNWRDLSERFASAPAANTVRDR